MSEKTMFRIRLDPEMKARLQREADFACRSLNAEIVYRLGLSLDGDLRRVGEKGGDYRLSDGELVMLDKLRRLGGADAGAAAVLIDALAARSPQSSEPAVGSE